jgi:hypothetical protein
MDIIKLKEARKQGLTYYYTGKPCKKGHDSMRMVRGGACRQCKNEYAATRKKDPEVRKRESQYQKERHKKTYTKDKRREAYDRNIIVSMLYRAKRRAEERGLEFSIDVEDIIIPNTCPVLGTEIKRVWGKKESSPSLDRMDPTKGYTKENSVVISNRANRLKSDATLEDITKIMEYMKGSKL